MMMSSCASSQLLGFLAEGALTPQEFSCFTVHGLVDATVRPFDEQAIRQAFGKLGEVSATNGFFPLSKQGQHSLICCAATDLAIANMRIREKRVARIMPGSIS